MSTKRLTIVRFPDQKQETTGIMIAYENDQPGLKLATVELPWKDNKNQISCIPVGTYDVKKFNSPKHGLCFLIQNVPGRSMCEIHSANFARELLGCIAPGLSHADIDKDGLPDVTSSKIAMGKLLDFMPETFKLTIK